MTYDYRSDVVAGVAPYDWVEQSIVTLVELAPDLAKHLLIGINHYGYEHTDGEMQAVNFDQ